MKFIYKFKILLLFIFFLMFSVACIQSQPVRKAGYPRPYKVHGKWYQPLPSASGFTQQGLASWYGKKFHGRKTANGEIYNMYAFTAAHKTLPLGTWLRVTNLGNGKSIEVRVNDRGPFIGKRIIDLSYKAAVKLEMTGTGTARVKIRTINKKDVIKKKTKKVSMITPTGVFAVQTGSFSSKINAEKFMRDLDRIYKNVHIVKENGVFKIRVGRYKLRDDAEKTKAALKHAGYPAFIVKV